MKNKVIASLIIVTGVLFTGAVFTEVNGLFSLGTITGITAIFTSLLIKEKYNG